LTLSGVGQTPEGDVEMNEEDDMELVRQWQRIQGFKQSCRWHSPGEKYIGDARS
jgi:hypothetical protein